MTRRIYRPRLSTFQPSVHRALAARSEDMCVAGLKEARLTLSQENGTPPKKQPQNCQGQEQLPTIHDSNLPIALSSVSLKIAAPRHGNCRLPHKSRMLNLPPSNPHRPGSDSPTTDRLVWPMLRSAHEVHSSARRTGRSLSSIASATSGPQGRRADCHGRRFVRSARRIPPKCSSYLRPCLTPLASIKIPMDRKHHHTGLRGATFSSTTPARYPMHDNVGMPIAWLTAGAQTPGPQAPTDRHRIVDGNLGMPTRSGIGTSTRTQ